MLLNDGAPTTTSNVVTVNSAVGGATKMRLSNDGVTWPGWSTYVASKSWTLTTGAGTKTVYAQYQNIWGEIATLSDSIETAGFGDEPGTMLVNNGAVATTSNKVTVTSAVIGATKMRLSNDGVTWPNIWVTYAASKSWTLTTGSGTKTVYAQYQNVFGEIVTLSDSIEAVGFGDPPGTMLLNNGAGTTTVGTVQINSAVPSAAKMRFSNNGGATWSGWVTYAATKSWTLTTGVGTKTVSGQYQNAWGEIVTLVDSIERL